MSMKEAITRGNVWTDNEIWLADTASIDLGREYSVVDVPGL